MKSIAKVERMSEYLPQQPCRDALSNNMQSVLHTETSDKEENAMSSVT
jgi:hypothetical protein